MYKDFIDQPQMNELTEIVNSDSIPFVPEHHLVDAFVTRSLVFNVYYTFFFPVSRVREESGRMGQVIPSKSLFVVVSIDKKNVLQLQLKHIVDDGSDLDNYTKTPTFQSIVNAVTRRIQEHEKDIRLEDVIANVPKDIQTVISRVLLFYRDLTAFGFSVTDYKQNEHKWWSSQHIVRCRENIESVRQKWKQYIHAKFGGAKTAQSELSELCSMDQTQRLINYLQDIIEGVAENQEDIVRERLEPLSQLYHTIRPLCKDLNNQEQSPWFQAHTMDELLQVSTNWINGKFISTHPISGYSNNKSRQSAMDLDDAMDKLLKYLHTVGLITEDSQPGTCNSDERQRIYVISYSKRENAQRIFDLVKSDDPICAIMIDSDGSKITDPSLVQDGRIPVTMLSRNDVWKTFTSTPIDRSYYDEMNHFLTSLLQIVPDEAANAVVLEIVWKKECDNANDMLQFLQRIL